MSVNLADTKATTISETFISELKVKKKKHISIIQSSYFNKRPRIETVPII